MNRIDPGDTRADLEEYRRGTDLRAIGFWFTFAIAPVAAWVLLIIYLIGGAL